jgi:hypothetical protein
VNGAIIHETTIPSEVELKGQGLVPAKADPITGKIVLDASGKPLLDYDLAIPSMLLHYFPTGILGLGLTALLASFMSGMAGNVTAFNTVWTYDLYQSYIHKGASDKHYLAMGRWATVGGILLSMATAYAATGFNNIMDTLQLVFSFVNAPLFATFLLGMFWKRATGNGAFIGLISGTVAAVAASWLTLPIEAHPGLHGGWIAIVHHYPSDMAQNFWTAIWAFSVNFLVTIMVSLFGKPKPEVGAGGAGAFAYAQAGAGSSALVAPARDTGCRAVDHGGFAEHYFPVKNGRLGATHESRLTHPDGIDVHAGGADSYRLWDGHFRQRDLCQVAGHQCQSGLGAGAAGLRRQHVYSRPARTEES